MVFVDLTYDTYFNESINRDICRNYPPSSEWLKNKGLLKQLVFELFFSSEPGAILQHYFPTKQIN